MESRLLSPLKWLSLMIAGVTSVVSTAVLAHTAGPSWTEAGGTTLDLAFAAVLIGTIVGGFLWLFACTFDGEMRRANAVVRAMLESDATGSSSTPTPLRWRFGFGPMIELVQHWQSRMSGRITELSASRRAMDVQLTSVETRRHHLEAVLDTITEAVIVTDALDELVLANEAAARLLKVNTPVPLRRPAEEVIPDASLVRMIRDTREGGRSIPRLVRRVQHQLAQGSDANVVDVTMQCLSLSPDVDGEFKPGCGGVVTVLKDVSREVESAERRSDFVSSVSHELRTPLSSIKGCLEMLIDGEATEAETRAEFYQIIQSEANRLQRLVDNILSISRIESGLIRTVPREASLADLIGESVAAIRPHARSKGVELSRWDAAGAATCVVLVDREMIQDVLVNLLNNAVKFTPSGGKVTITAELESEGGFARVTIADTGVGIPAGSLPGLFQKFSRVQDHSHLGKGTGLGLNLVKHIVETVHGGTIGVTSEVGRGSAFTFTLPLADNNIRSGLALTAAEPGFESSGGRRS